MKTYKYLNNKFNKILKEKGIFDFTEKLQGIFKGSEHYLVGGVVRDIILGRPVKDIDLLIKGVEIKDLERELKKLGKVNLVGQRFSVLKFRPSKCESGIDIAIPRKDFPLGTGVYTDFKVKSDPNLPIEKDLSRRDFTINAMAWDILKGGLIDPFCGMSDLKKKTIRAVGDAKERFKEDYSRMLRAIRFAAQLGFKIEPKTWRAIRQNMSHINDKILKGNNKERKVPYEVIAGEFLKGFDADPIKTIKFYFDCGAAAKLMPEVFKMKGCGQPKEFHSEGDVLTHTLVALEKVNSSFFKKYFGTPPNLTTKVAIFLHDIGKPYTKKKMGKKTVFYNHHKRGAEIAAKLIERLKLTAPPEVGIDGDEALWLIRNHLLFLHSDPRDMKKTTIEKYLFNKRFSGLAHMQLFLADALSTQPKGGKPDLGRFREAMRIIEKMKHEKSRELPKPILNGAEVMKLLKIKPGPKVGEILELLREEQLSGRIKSKEKAAEFLKSLN